MKPSNKAKVLRQPMDVMLLNQKKFNETQRLRIYNILAILTHVYGGKI
jgi:hypothetical protein